MKYEQVSEDTLNQAIFITERELSNSRKDSDEEAQIKRRLAKLKRVKPSRSPASARRPRLYLCRFRRYSTIGSQDMYDQLVYPERKILKYEKVFPRSVSVVA